MHRRGPSHQNRHRGQALVEFALVFPVMILLIVAVFDLGRLVFAYNDVTNAARTGVRVAIVDQTASVAQTATISQATSLGLLPADVTVDYLTADLSDFCPTPRTLDCIAQITARFRWQPITPIIGSIVGPITVTTVTREPIERIYP